jgi:predicted dinucleotide-binding enzyme
MRYAIIGFGRIGHAIAGAFARSGVELSVATTRDPESFACDVPVGSRALWQCAARTVPAAERRIRLLTEA